MLLRASLRTFAALQPAHLIEKSSIFDRIDGIKLLSTRQLKKIEKMDFCW